jgi:hypothetical protein
MLGRFTDKKEQHQIILNNHELELEEARDMIVDLKDKVKEQESIIDTLLAQVNYYKDRHDSSNQS